MHLEEWNDSRINELVALWNKELGEEFPMRESLFRQNSFDDPNIDRAASSIAINEKNEIVGFLTAKRWQEKESDVQLNPKIGWIQSVLVKKEERNKGIGSDMLKKAEHVLSQHGVTQVLFGRDPWHYFPGIPHGYIQAEKWAQKHSYVSDNTDIDLIADFDSTNNTAMPVLNKEAQFSILKKNEKEEFMSFLHRCFPGRWEYEAVHYFKKGGNGREYVILRVENDIVGFCRINDPQSPFIAQNVYWSPLVSGEMGGIGPLGLDEAQRKKGYGLKIVQAGQAVLKQRGMEHIVIDWTGLSAFYEKLGYRPWKKYTKYEKNLKPEHSNR